MTQSTPTAPPPPPGRGGHVPKALGGRRPGAGRPRAYTEPLLRKTVTLPRSYIQQLEAFSGGNLSEGIRLLVEFAYTRDGTLWLRPLPEHQPAPRRPSRALAR